MRVAKPAKVQPTTQTKRSAPAPLPGRQELGRKIRDLRLERGLTLEEVSREAKVARSTLSKIENGVMSPTFDILQKLAAGLSLDIGMLFNPAAIQQSIGRRSISKNGCGPKLSGENYVHEALASDIARKRILPFRTKVVARTIEEFGNLISHKGEVFLFVVRGEIDFFSDLYSPLRLEAGDSVYFDSRMAHAIISVSEEEADIVWVCDNLAGVEETDLGLR